MTAYNINLKLRNGKQVITALKQIVVDIIKSGDKEVLWNTFKQLTEDDTVHDKEWLEMIVNWVPSGGLPLTEMSRWLKLAKRVGDLDGRPEGTFTLSEWHVNLIWDRLTNEDFKLSILSPAFAAFLLDFQAVTGKSFEDGEPDFENEE
ncbi:hypothetical protein LCGC14_2052560 [marine sediment metagenome]|uniref:Uncharacterized protein n=1 Tax=marine sediment metagenome TaxID=412755 RepID=A0A0F9H206_9ZZZZ